PLDPHRLKRQVADLKKKAQQQSTDNQNLNTALVTVRKELKETSGEKDKLQQQLSANQNGSDFFWQSADEVWVLYESSVVLKDESVENPEKFKRIRVFNTQSGMSALSQGKDENDLALWLGTLEVPAEVSQEAGKRMLTLAAELEEEDNAG
ncbi:MAG: hypothetical protein LBE21_02360, partial [Pseudomonadales bacterium]|nr:hypothetical protein [Pseudomonadales bacterium]